MNNFVYSKKAIFDYLNDYYDKYPGKYDWEIKGLVYNDIITSDDGNKYNLDENIIFAVYQHRNDINSVDSWVWSNIEQLNGGKSLQ